MLTLSGAGAPILVDNKAAPAVLLDNESTPLALISQRTSTLADSLRSHLENLDKYASLAREYDNQVEALRGAAQPNLREIAAAEAKLEQLRIDLPKFQSEFRSVISKIKSAGKWTRNLDSSFETIAIRENRDLAQLVKERGGVRSVLEKLAAALGKLPAAIDESERNLSELKAKAVGTVDRLDVKIIGVGYTAAPANPGGKISCTTTVTYCTVCILVYRAIPEGSGEYSLETDLKCTTKKCNITRTCGHASDLLT